MTTKTTEIELDMETKQNIIVSQTNYTIEQATELLENNNGDYKRVILEYLKKDTSPIEASQKCNKPSLNQTIYKHIRAKMNENMDEVISRMSGNL